MYKKKKKKKKQENQGENIFKKPLKIEFVRLQKNKWKETKKIDFFLITENENEKYETKIVKK